MPLTGTFLADFSSFTKACAEAEVSLKSFEGDAHKVETSLNKMADAFSGRKIIQEATLMAAVFERAGSAAKFTEAELERMGAVGAEAVAKMNALGEKVPPGIARIAAESKSATTMLESMKSTALSIAGAFGVAFSIGAVVNFSKGLVDGAGALVDLSAKTGVSIEQLQRFQFVGAQSKVSVEDFAAASFKLGMALAGNAKGSVRQAVTDLGLSYETLKHQSPDAQFNATIAALERMADPQERNRVAFELFGKSFAAIAPAVASGYAEMATHAEVSSASQVRAINEAAAAWARWKTNSTTGLTSILGSLVIADEEFKKLSTSEKAASLTAILFGGSAAEAATQLAILNAQASARAKQIDINLPKEAAVVDAAAEYAKEAAEAAKALDGLSAADERGINAALQIGRAHDEITVKFHLTDDALALYIDRQQKAVVAANALAAATKKQIDTQEAAILATQKLMNEYDAQRVSHGGTANDIAIAGIKKWAADTEDAAKKAGTATASFYNALALDSQEKLGAVGIDWALWTSSSIKGLRETADNARATYNEMIASGAFFRADLDKQLEKTREAEAAARGMGASYVDAFTTAAEAAKKQAAEMEKINKASEAAALLNRQMGGSTQYDLSTAEGRRKVPADIAALLHDGYNFEQAARLSYAMKMGFSVDRDPLFAQKGPRVPGFAGGVQNFSGGWAMVGERGPELVNLPRGSSVLPNGAAGMSVHITINGSVLGNKDQIAAVVSDALMARLRSTGMRFPTGA